jgi:formate C-acetyltransferase
MALNDGLNPVNGAQSKIHSGYLYEMTSIEEVREAIRKQIEHTLMLVTSACNHMEYMVKGRVYYASLSCATVGCMEKGMDIQDGGAKYNSYGATVTGLATLADSLSSIKYMCFDHDYCTTRELYDAMMANWEGYEDLRERILNEVPHFGNDDPYVDEELKWAVDTIHAISAPAHNERAKTFKTGLYGASDHIVQGKELWATPDGRKAYTPLADANSPAQGRDQHGPTAIFNSSACFDHSKIMDGIALNIKIHPASVRTDEGVGKLRDMTKAYFDKGGMEVQYNIVSGDTLRAAQADPDEYKDLVVRIAGFSAYFVDMAPELQNDIISRNEVVV